MSTILTKIVLLVLGVLTCYALIWIAVYSVVMEGDFRFAREYFVLGWRGGGEYPTFIQAMSIGATLVTTIVGAILFMQYFSGKRS